MWPPNGGAKSPEGDGRYAYPAEKGNRGADMGEKGGKLNKKACCISMLGGRVRLAIWPERLYNYNVVICNAHKETQTRPNQQKGGWSMEQNHNNDYIIEMLHITKEFPGIKANDDITLQLRRGEIHALLGENGAGKSTLMSVLFGLYQPEKGEIRKNGVPVKINDPNDATALGIGMVHQHFKLIDVFTVLDNIILGAEDTKLGFLQKKKARQKVKELSEKYGLAIDMDAKVERCMKRAPEGEHLTRSEMEKAIRRIDKERAQNHLMYADTKWGSKESYHLCVNTTHREIKQLVPALAQFCKDWFAAE